MKQFCSLIMGAFFLVSCVLLGGGEAAVAAPATATTRQNTAGAQEVLTRLPNGLLVYIIKDTRFPLVCTRLYVRTGSANESPEQAGISHVLEHMVFKGTEHRPKGQIAKDVEARGGYLNAATSFDQTYYLTDMPAEHWRMGMDVVKDMAFNARFDAKELEAEKNVVISELEGDDDTPSGRLFEALQVATLKNTVYGRPIIGFKDTIRALRVQDLKSYVDRWYQPQNMMLLVAGDIDPKAVLAHAQQLFGGLKNRSGLPMPAPVALESAMGGPQVEIIRGPWNKVYLGLALPAPALGDARSLPLDVMSYLLGGDATSLLYKKYKYDKQLVESISVGNMSLARAGLFIIHARLDAEHVDSFWNGLTKDLASLDVKKFPADAVRRAQYNLQDSMDRAGETLNGLASWRGTVQFDLGGREAEQNMRLALENVDHAQLQAAKETWLRPERVRVRVLAPQNAALPDLEAILQRNWPAQAGSATTKATAAKAGARETLDLGAGRTLILLPDASIPYVSMTMMMPGGNALLQPHEQGLANLTASALTDGSGSRNAQALERFLAERAASLSASAGMQTFTLGMTGPSRFLGDYCSFLKEVLEKPRFDEKDIRRESLMMRAALQQRQDNPLRFLFSKLNPFLYPKHLYGFDPLGTEELLQRYGRKEVRDFWERQAKQPWVLAVSGSFDRDSILAFARSLPKPSASGVQVNAPEWGTERKLKVVLPGRNQAHLVLNYKAVPLDHPDAPALMLLQSVLSGQSGLLFNDLRDKQGLGYTVTALYRSMPEAGSMVFYIGTTPEKVDKAREGFARVIQSIQEKPLDKALLHAALNRMEGSYYRERQSLGARATEAATDVVLQLPQDSRKRLLEKAAQVSPAELQRIARLYLTPEARYEALLTP